MYLTRINLDMTKTNTMKALVCPSRFHGAIESAESDGRTRKLWRIDELGGEKYLLILSEKELDFSNVSDRFGAERPQTKCYDTLLDRVKNSSKWQFRLKANPVIHKKDTNSHRGRPVGLIGNKQQEEWLKKQALKNGFSLEDGMWLVTEFKWYDFKKGERRNHVRILSVTYEGVLTVTDEELLKVALTNGIGREKAYGLGMLPIVGVR